MTGPTPAAASAAVTSNTSRPAINTPKGRACAPDAATASTAVRAAVAGLVAAGAKARPFGLLVAGDDVFDATAALADAGVGPVTVANPTYVFEAASEVTEELARRLQLQN